MRYEPGNGEYYFNQEMILSDAESAANYAHYRSYAAECLNHPVNWMGNMMKPSEGTSPAAVILGIVAVVALFGGILSTIFCIACKTYGPVPWIMAGVMGLTGIYSLFFADSKAEKVFAESVLCQRIEGAVGIIGSLVMIVIGAGAVPMDNIAIFNMTVFAVVCYVLFLVMLIKSIGIINAPKSIYTEEVRATCIGYVRGYESSNSDGAGSNLHPVHSPVFEYCFGGSKYLSYYDLMASGKDGKIEVGAESIIKIDPDNPNRVMGNCKGYAITPILFALMSLAGGVILTVFLLK